MQESHCKSQINDTVSLRKSEDLNKNTITAKAAVKAQHDTKTASAETKSQKKGACPEQSERWKVILDNLQTNQGSSAETGAKAQE